MPRSDRMDEVVEAARADRDLSVVICDLLAERRRGFLHSSAEALVRALERPFPFFLDEALRAPLSEHVTSASWDEMLRDLNLVADMLSNRIQLLDGAMLKLLVEAVHRSHPDLGQAASDARERALEDAIVKAKALLDWERRIEHHADELSSREGFDEGIREVSVTLDDLRRELGV